jgi:hypothetical protein
MVARQETQFHMFLGRPERALVRAVHHFLRCLQPSWASLSLFSHENATLHSSWGLWNDVLSPSKLEGRAGIMQQNEHSVAPSGWLDMGCHDAPGHNPIKLIRS